jgi:penicillin amidase
LDLPAKAQELWKAFPEEKKSFLIEYSQGVNEGFKEGKNAREFTDLNFTPEPWTPQDTILVLLLQSFDQTRKTFIQEIEEEKFKEKWGKEASTLFDEDDVPWLTTILKEGEYNAQVVDQKTVRTSSRIRLWADFPSVFGEESGSNNWAISKDHSENGKAVLANDPHLDLKTPLFWYWVKFKNPGGALMGATLPGVPVIASGTNGKVAWGLTNSYFNSADALYVKDLEDKDLTVTRPTVWVKLGFLKLPFIFKSFEKLSPSHPLLPVETERNERIVLRWTGFGLKIQDILPMFDLIHVQNVDQMNELLSKIGIPSWNFVFADQKGEIGYRMVGEVFQETKKSPLGITTVTKKELGGTLLPASERPSVMRPKRGFIFTANHRHFPNDSKFYGGRAYSKSFRARRIEEVLERERGIGASMKLQCDIFVNDAPFFLPLLEKYLKPFPFTDWDMVANEGSTLLPLYRRLIDLLLEKWEVNEFALFHLLQDLPEKKIKEVTELYELAKADVQGRNWGALHLVNFPHLSKNDAWAFAPTIGGIGDTHTVNPGTAKWNAEKKVYEHYSGASMRMIVELGESPKLWLSLPGRNRDYTASHETQWTPWRSCQYEVFSVDVSENDVRK